MQLILIGPPGSGKGTQAKLLSKRQNLTHIATGDILREAIRVGSPLGQKAAPFIREGKLVPDDLVNEVIADLFKREDRPDRFVLDGYPRTLAQAVSFDQVLGQQFLKLSNVLHFFVDDNEIVSRMSGRWSCPKCKSTFHLVNNPPKKPGFCDHCGGILIQRVDDRESTVRERLRIYHASTTDLIPYYRDKGLLSVVQGVGSIEDIYERIVHALKASGT